VKKKILIISMIILLILYEPWANSYSTSCIYKLNSHKIIILLSTHHLVHFRTANCEVLNDGHKFIELLYTNKVTDHNT